MESEKEPTKEELEFFEAKKVEMLEYYAKELPFLLKQLEYEDTITKLEESRARRLNAQRIIAQMMAPPPGEPKEGKERKLRVE